MNIYEIRRKNLQSLADQHFPGHGQQTKLAEFMGWKSPVRASQLLNENGLKNIGDTIARLVERKFSLPKDWLDHAHQDMWIGRLSIRESLAPDYITTTERTPVMGIPLLKDAEAVRWLAGERFQPLSEIKFPILPMMQVSEHAFVMEETTTSMPPQKPGDFYYVDPLTEPQGGDWAVAVIDDSVVVGIYEKGRVRDLISFTSGREAAVEISKDSTRCKIITRMDGGFARIFSAG